MLSNHPGRQYRSFFFWFVLPWLSEFLLENLPTLSGSKNLDL